MTDAHCHVARGASRSFLCDPCDTPSPGAGDVRFVGTHPWLHEAFDADALRARLAADPRLGVGEIGLDRLRERDIPQRMREVFEAQLEIAAEFSRPVVLHGAKCWGEVVKAIEGARRRFAGVGRGFAAFLFHGFSRSDGLLPDIVALDGYVSVGPALLNDHAVNYRELARRIPQDRLLVESDATAATAASAPQAEDVAAKLAELRGVPADALAARLEANADAFAGCLLP
ncbi:MAG: TatD family hydrolase [Kiritimatiellae bacterium]|nr:TatD family hydrolase [Kiritimatiellia bacterium]